MLELAKIAYPIKYVQDEHEDEDDELEDQDLVHKKIEADTLKKKREKEAQQLFERGISWCHPLGLINHDFLHWFELLSATLVKIPTTSGSQSRLRKYCPRGEEPLLLSLTREAPNAVNPALKKLTVATGIMGNIQKTDYNFAAGTEYGYNEMISDRTKGAILDIISKLENPIIHC